MSSRTVDYRLNVMAIGIDYEGSIVGRPVVRPQTRRSVACTSAGNCRRVKGINRPPAWRRKRQMEAWPGRLRIGSKFQTELVVSIFDSVAYRCGIGEHAPVSQGAHDSVIERASARQVGNGK